MYVSENLKQFAQFVREHELDSMIDSYLELVYTYNIPLLQFFTHLSQDEIREQSKEGVLKFLEGFEKGTALDNLKESLKQWEADQLPGIPKTAITQLDITLINTAQKVAFLKHLPLFAKHAEIPTEILVELEDYYKEAQLLSLNALQSIQKQQQLQLEESEARYRELFDNASDLIHMVSPEGNLMYVNNAWKRTLGYSEKEIKGLNVYDLVIEEDRELYRQCREEVLKKAQNHGSVSITFIAKNGKRVHVEDSLTAKFKNGKAEYSQCIMRDITVRKEYERRLEENNKELEQYAWLASHDLKEPLRKILTFSDMLLTRYNKGMEERVAEGLQKINSSAYRMYDMIEAVLSYSSLATEMENIKLVDLNELVSEVLADLEMVIEEKQATVNVSALGEMEGDPRQLRQLFQNLISNALKYSREDVPPVIDITGSKDENVIKIEVADNGIGFDEQYADKMFQIFKRLVGKDEFKGTGIGLAMCRKIVTNHGGIIKASSPDGKGAIFSIDLPIYKSRH